MKRKCFCLAILIVLALICTVQAKERKIDETEKGEVSSEEVYDQTNALLAYDSLFQTFAHDTSGLPIYPDNFSSAYIDGEMLVVRLSDIREETIHYYTEILGEYAEYVRFEEADYSRNELTEIMVDAISPCLEEGCGIFGCYVSEYDDQIIVECEKNSSFIETVKTFSDAKLFSIKYSEGYTTDTTLRAGDYITNSYGAGMTLGVCGRYGGDNSILTCGHGVSFINQDFYYDGTSSMGKASIKSFPSGGGYSTGDYGIVKITSGDSISYEVWEPYDSSTIQYIYGTYSNPPANTVVYRYGISTHYSTATVYSTNGYVLYIDSDGYHWVYGISRATTSTMSVGGDSGGPYFVKMSGHYYFCGIHSGSDSGKIVFTPLSVIYNATGFAVETGP